MRDVRPEQIGSRVRDCRSYNRREVFRMFEPAGLPFGKMYRSWPVACADEDDEGFFPLTEDGLINKTSSKLVKDWEKS